MNSGSNKILAALKNPQAAFLRLAKGLAFGEIVLMKELKTSGFLDGVTTVIDAGAHHGHYARVFASVLPDAQILCFEPIPETFRALVQQTADSPRIKCYPIALGSSCQDALMNVSGIDQASSLLTMNDTHTGLWPGSETVGTVEVKLDTLDNVLDKVPGSGDIFLKMDVQGYEMELLKGATRSLKRIKLIRFEASFVPLYHNGARFSEIFAFLEDNEFRYVRTLGAIYGKEKDLPAQADVLFVRQ